MKKAAIVISSILTGILTLPTVATAKNNYPVFPQKPDGKQFDELTEEQQSAYLEAVGTYRSALCTAYRNEEYDWDFNLDGETTPLDAMYVGQYYAELSSGKKLDTFYYQGNDNITAYSFDDNMRAKISENGDVTSNGYIDIFDATQMLIALYSDKVQGDANSDGMVDARDASAVLKFYANNSVSIQSDYVTEKNMEYLGDLNGDDKTDAKDASDILAIYASNSTHPSDESKTVWTETEPGEQVEISSVYKIFDRDNYLNQTSLIFDGTVTDIKEYAVSGQYENGEKWGPSNRTIIEVTVNDVYYGETDKNTIKFFYNTSLSRHSKGSFTIETGREYVFMAKELDDNAIQNLDAAKYADYTITAGLRDGIMPVSDGIVSVYHEYFDDNEIAISKALTKETVIDKLTDDAKIPNWFMYFNKNDFTELLSQLFSNRSQPSDESKAVWTEVEISDSIGKTSITYEPFDLEKIKGETDLVFRGTVTDRKEYSVEWLDENGEKWGPYPSSVIEVKIDEIYSGEYDKNTIKVYYPLSFSQLLTSSFLIKDDTSYIFIANSFDEDWYELKANNPYDRFEQEKYADVYITNSRDAIMPITDGIVSVYDEYVADNAEAVSKAIAKEEIEDKIPEEIKDSKRFYFYSIEDIKSLLAELF